MTDKVPTIKQEQVRRLRENRAKRWAEAERQRRRDAKQGGDPTGGHAAASMERSMGRTSRIGEVFDRPRDTSPTNPTPPAMGPKKRATLPRKIPGGVS